MSLKNNTAAMQELLAAAQSMPTADEVYAQGYEAGAQSEYDRFWDAYQENGNRTEYRQLFMKTGWNNETFKPKYPITPLHAMDMLAESAVTTSEHLKKIDLSNCVYNAGVFRASLVEELGVIDISKTAAGWGFTGIFSGANNLRKIEKFVFPTDEACAYNYPFQACNSLTDITIGGTIHKTISFQWSTLLSHDSFVSIVTAISTTASITVTFSLTAVNNAFETSEGAADGSTSEEWLALVATRPNCTISLA